MSNSFCSRSYKNFRYFWIVLHWTYFTTLSKILQSKICHLIYLFVLIHINYQEINQQFRNNNFVKTSSVPLYYNIRTCFHFRVVIVFLFVLVNCSIHFAILHSQIQRKRFRFICTTYKLFILEFNLIFLIERNKYTK